MKKITIETLIRIMEKDLVHSCDCLEGKLCNCGIKKVAQRILNKIYKDKK